MSTAGDDKDIVSTTASRAADGRATKNALELATAAAATIVAASKATITTESAKTETPATVQ